jgi:GTP cyclohydrolase II
MKEKIKKSSATLARIAKKLDISPEQLLDKLSFLAPHRQPPQRVIHLTDNEMLRAYTVKCVGIGNIVTAMGEFMEYAFEVDDAWTEYSVLVKAKAYDDYRMPVFSPDKMLTRFDSHCETQMLFHDQTCDCMQQLTLAMQMIQQHGEGVIVHIKRHEGRGKGIGSKLDQLAICRTLGVNTVDGSLLRAIYLEDIGVDEFPVISVLDKRDFVGCVAILKYFGINNDIQLLLQTNNPYKMKALKENGYNCEFFEIRPADAPQESLENSKAKCEHLGHKHLTYEK